MKKHLSAGSALLLSLLLQSNIHASYVPGVAIQAVSSETSNGGNDQRTATNLVNGTGLFGNNQTWNITGSGWLTSDNTAGAYSNAFVTFDLGAVHTLDRLKVYNYNEASTTSTAGTSNGVQRADILFGTTLGIYDTTNANVLFNRAPGTFSDFSQTISVGGISARYVRINVITNWGGVTAAPNKVGLSKVLFVDTNMQATATLATRNFSSNSVTVWFSEVVTAASATNLANYTVSSGSDTPAILSAAMGIFNDSVILQTAPLTNSAYTIGVTNVAAASDGTKITNSISVQSQLAFWLKADAGVTLDGTAVTNWADQSGNGNNAAQTTVANQPSYVASDINGLPSVQFGSLKFLDIPQSSTMDAPRDISVFAVLKVTAKANNEIFSRAVGNRAAPWDYRFTSTAATIFRGNEGGNGSFSSAPGSTNFAVNQPALATAIISGTNGVHYLNGLLNGSGMLLIGYRNAQAVTRIAGRADNGVSLSGSIAELMLFRGAVSASDRLAINGYLANKYALAISDLAFQTQPVGATLMEGLMASFSALAVASSTNVITYQWKTNGVNIPNATNTSYTTPVLTLANSNTTFTVVATAGSNIATSAPAILNVFPDTVQPTVVYAGVEIWNTNKIVVVFSESVLPSVATNLSSYALDNGATVTLAVMGDSPNKVILSASGLVTGTSYLLSVQNIQDLFANIIVPVQVPVGLYPRAALWLKSNAGVTTDGSSNVTQWDDQSGNGNNAFSAGSPPTFVASGFNGQPVIRFDGTNNYLAVLSSASLAITGDLAIYTVAQFVDYDSAAGVGIVGKTGGAANNIPAPYDYYAGPGSGRLRLYRGNGGTGGSGVSFQNVTSLNAPSLGFPHVLVANMQGTTATHYLDGVENGTGSIAVPIADAGNPLGIGTRNDLLTKMKGDIGELMIFDVALEASDRTALDNYLGTKFGVSIGPVIPPTLSITRTAGNVVVAWPTPTTTFILESATNLIAGGWATMTNSISTSAGTNSVTVPTSGQQQYYRLRTP